VWSPGDVHGNSMCMVLELEILVVAVESLLVVGSSCCLQWFWWFHSS
jgi:hypothetical protein